jgi:hypothetical protein
MSAAPKNKPTWKDLKLRLQELDQGALLELIQDLYTAHKDTQVFLHARFSLGDDVLRPYKETIDRWLWPDVFKQQDTSIAKAKKAVADYKKATALATRWTRSSLGMASADLDSLAALRAENARLIGLLEANGIAWRTTTTCTRSAGRARPLASRATRQPAPTSGGRGLREAADQVRRLPAPRADPGVRRSL